MISTRRPESVFASTFRSRTSTRLHHALRSRIFCGQVVDQQVDADRKAGDGERGNDDRRGPEGQAADILAHQRAPVGIGRLHAEPQEGEPGQQKHDEDEAQAKIGQHRADDVGQDLGTDEIEDAFATGACDGDEVHGIDVHGERPGKAVGAGDVDNGERHDQHRDRRADRGDDNQTEQLAWDRVHGVQKAAEQVSSQPPMTAAIIPSTTPVEAGDGDGGKRDADGVAGAHQNAREHVAAQIVGAEPELRRIGPK